MTRAVESGRTRLVVLAGVFAGAGSDAAQVTSWVESQFKAQSVGGEAVYDLAAPDAAS